ncbi:MAG TPA: TetR/AcrR family transcriptional regulator [Gammaproteobacteria bacterium]|nr:TetR/AcrR family transcriptional regulator [Gammaproteobacteria bacterium]
MASAPATVVATSSETVTRILTAAEALFAEHGFDAVSMNAIAERAGVSKANVFHHFNTKQDLYLAVIRAACHDASQHLDDLGNDDAPMAERFEGFARAHLTSLLEHEQVARLTLRELLGEDPHRGQALAEQVYGEKFARFVAILRAGQNSGELRADIDPAAVATLLIGANVFFFEAREVLRHFPEISFARQPDRYSELLTEILLRGILPSDSSPSSSARKRS